MIDDSLTRNISVSLVLECLEKNDVDIEPVLIHSGLQIHEICKKDGWVPFCGHARFFDAAAKALKDPCFALKLSSNIHLREFGALTYVGISSKTLEDLLFNLKRYIGLVTEAWRLDIRFHDKTVTLEIIPTHPDYFRYQTAIEWLVINLIHGFQFSIGKALPPQKVCFVAPLSTQMKLGDYEKIFGCPVSFSQSCCKIVLDRNDLKFPIKSSDDRLLKVLKQHCDQLLHEHSLAHAGFTAKVREQIIDLLPSGRAKAKYVAKKLGLTQRTMLRRLAEENTSFSEVREALQSDLAVKYIQEKRLSLKQIAYLLGYSDQSAFSVAFKRWKGCTPKEARTKS